MAGTEFIATGAGESEAMIVPDLSVVPVPDLEAKK